MSKTLGDDVADIKQEISGVMRKGTDVDGKLWPTYDREHVWKIFSAEYPIDAEGAPFRGIRNTRPVCRGTVS